MSDIADITGVTGLKIIRAILAGVDLTRVDGLNALFVKTILSEIGTRLYVTLENRQTLHLLARSMPL